MKFAKKLFALLLCFVICFSLCVSTLAATGTTKITVSSVDAMPGDAVTITIDISNNPGIMAMAFCITYDRETLSFKNYSKGYLSSYTVKDHSDKGHVSFVNVENKDIATNGTIISLVFQVKENAKPGKSVISLANSNRDKHGTKLHNSFSNSNQEFVIPSVTSGGVTIAENCNNAGHTYSEWNLVYNATCTTPGLRNRLCSRCNTIDEEQIPASHDFELDWTVDKAATPDEDGEMSRHCTKCDQVTDKISFSYKEIDGSDDTSSDDASSSEISSDDVSSSEVSSTESDAESNNTSSAISSSAEPTESKPIQKPVINNTVGEKVPLAEVEKFEGYEEITKPDTDSSDDEITSDNNDSSDIAPSNPSTSVDATTDTNSQTGENNNSYITTTGGIITLILCAILSVGTIALGVLLIIRKKQ